MKEQKEMGDIHKKRRKNILTWAPYYEVIVTQCIETSSVVARFLNIPLETEKLLLEHNWSEVWETWVEVCTMLQNAYW